VPVAIVAGFHVPGSQKRGRDRPKPFSATRSAGFKLSASFFICSFENAFYVDDASYFSVFLRSFTKSSKTLFASVKAGSEIMKNGLLCGDERRKRSMTARIDFVDEVLDEVWHFFPRRPKTRQAFIYSFDIFSISFQTGTPCCVLGQDTLLS